MQILKTKFHIPEFNPATSVPRKRLSSMIGHSTAIVVMAAPAGFGKTTLLSEWARTQKDPVALVSLEKSEDTPAVFWSYVLTAIGSVTGGCGRTALQQIASSDGGSMETVLIGLINELTDRAVPFTLVLDDYHVIADSQIHKSLEFFIDHLPLRMRIIISGRQKPRLSLSKFRISGNLVDIREQDLRFQDKEAETLLNTIHGLDLEAPDIVLLKTRTEGWAAGLILAILSIRDQQDKHTFIQELTGSHRLVLDYLMDEVLEGLDGDLREFMKRISVLERFCPSLCNAVTGRDDSRTLIRTMDAANLFLIPLDDQGEWFRFHHLFRDFLHKTLTEKGGDTEKACHERAFAWLKDRAYKSEAYDHAILAGNMAAAADLLADHGPWLIGEAGGFLLRKWIDRLPESVVSSHPEVCCYHSLLSVMAGDFGRESLLENTVFQGNPTVEGYRSLIKSYRYFYQDGAFEACIREVSRMFDVIPGNHGFVRELGGLLLGLSLRYSGRIQEAYDMIRQIPPDQMMTPLRAINFADVLLGMGQLEEALDFLTAAIEKSEASLGENLLPEAGFLYVQKGNVLREKNRLDEAMAACKRGLFLGRNNEYIEFTFIGNLEYARVLAAAGYHAEAAKAINRSMTAARASATWGVNLTAAYKARMDIERGNLARARAVLDEIGTFDGLDIPYHMSNEWLSYCRLCLAEENYGRVHEVTGHMIREDLGSQRKARLMECYVMKALACQGMKRRPEALDALGKAFELTRREGHVRLYLDEGKPMLDLLKEASGQDGFPEYLKPYVQGRKEGRPVAPHERTVLINAFNETFNDREIAILKLMKNGCSNKMIAETLYLSVHTVRWYASRIFAKLDVKRRGEAVAHAEKYRLI